MALVINHYKPQTQSCSSAGLKSDKTSSKSPRGISPLYLGGDAGFFSQHQKTTHFEMSFFRNGPESTLLSKGTLDFIYAIILLYIYICLHNVSQLLHRFLIDTKITSLHIFHRSPALPKHAGVWPSKPRRASGQREGISNIFSTHQLRRCFSCFSFLIFLFLSQYACAVSAKCCYSCFDFDS